MVGTPLCLPLVWGTSVSGFVMMRTPALDICKQGTQPATDIMGGRSSATVSKERVVQNVVYYFSYFCRLVICLLYKPVGPCLQPFRFVQYGILYSKNVRKPSVCCLVRREAPANVIVIHSGINVVSCVRAFVMSCSARKAKTSLGYTTAQ